MNPKTKIYHNGKEINWRNQHGKISWFTRFQRWTVKWTKRVAFTAFVIGIIYGAFSAGSHATETTVVMAEDTSAAKYQDKIETLKNGVVDQLMKCERDVYGDDDGLVTYDPTDAQFAKNQTKRTIVDKGEMSYGVLQFKKSTVIHYTKLKTGKQITGKEALLIALDQNQSSDLAKFVMFSTKGKASGDWRNCALKHNLDAQIDVIKKLE